MSNSDQNSADAPSEQAELLDFVAATLERVGLRYAITGSHASIAYGENRFTNDIDVALEISESQLNSLLAEFPRGRFYVSEDGARYAAAHGGQFNIIDESSLQKVDLIVPRDPAWPDEFSRRVQLPTDLGRIAWFISREDLILRKVQAFEEGGSDKHLRDIASMSRIHPTKIDREYISKWADTLGFTKTWQLILHTISKP